MRYALFLGNLHVGDVRVVESDELTVRGDFELARVAASHPDAARLKQFIELNAECLRLTDRLDEPGVADELQDSNAELSAYVDLADSPNWNVVGSAGRRRPILCPLFADGGEITWRWGDT